MYDQSKLSELIRFARVEAGSTVIDVYPGDGDWTRLFSDIVGPEGRVYSFVPAEVAHFKNDPVGRMRALAKEPGPRERRSRLGGPRGDAGGHATSGCPVAAPVLPRSPHRADPGQGRDGGRLQSSRLRAAEARWVLRHRRPRRRRGAGTSDAQSLHRIEPASVREEVEAAGFVLDAESTMLANKDDPHSIKVFDPSIKGETDRFAYRFVKP